MGTSISATIQTTTIAAGVAPGPALGLATSNVTSSGFTATWSQPATGSSPFQYVLQYRVDGTSTWNSFPSSGTISGTTAVLTNLQPATQYDLQVVTSNGFGSPSTTAQITVTTAGLAPGAPTNLTSTANDTTSITVGWTPGAGSTPQTFTVSYRLAGTTNAFTAFGTTATTPATSLKVTGLQPATKYEFEVTAQNDGGSATSTTTTTATTLSSATIPSSPTNVTATSTDVTSIGVAWTAPANDDGNSTYTVQYSPTGKAQWVTAGTVQDPTTSFTITGLASGTTYDVQVLAGNSAGTSPPSAPLTTTTLTAGSIRRAWLQPGSADSTWNLPIGSAAQFSGTTDADTQALTAKTNTITTSEIGIFVAASTDPQVTFTSSADGTTQRDAGLTATIRCPSTAKLPGGANQMVIFDPSTDATKMWAFTQCSFVNGKDVTGGVKAIQGEVDIVCGSMEDAITGNFGWNCGVGVIRAWELDSTQNPSGLIQHGLRVGLDPTQLLPPPTWSTTTNSDGSVAIYWPQTHAKANAPTLWTGKVPFGALLAIPSSITMPSSLSAGGQILWKNAQQFGWHVREQSSGGATLFAEPSLAGNSLIAGMTGDLATIVAALRVVRNQGPNSVNGGGIPVASLPPPIDTAVCGALTAPGQVSNVTVANTAANSVTLDWNQTTGSGPLTYFIQWAPTGTTNWTKVTVGIDTNTGTVTGLTGSTGYDFQVYAKNSVATGAVSQTVTATTAAAASVKWATQTATAGVISISSDGQTATAGTVPSGTSATAMSATSQSAGLWYWEIEATQISNDWAAGLVNASFYNALGAGLGGDANGIGYYPVSPANTIWFNGALKLTPSASKADVSGAIIRFAANLNTGMLWVQSPGMVAAIGANAWNASTSADPAAGTGGIPIGMTGALFIAWNTEEASSATLNAAGPFANSVPNGFTAWAGTTNTGGGGGSTEVPGKPTALTVTATSATTASLSWTAPTDGGYATSYTIQAAILTQFSQAGSIATQDAGTTITDKSKNIWSINSSGQVVVNGNAASGTSGALVLAYLGDAYMWVLNNVGDWYQFNVVNNAASYVSGPAKNPLPQTASDTAVTGIGNAGITDSTGTIWTITVSKQVAKNGQANVGTSNITELAYVNGTVWQENSSGQWWGWDGTGWNIGNGTTTSPLPPQGATTTQAGGSAPAPAARTRPWELHPGTTYNYWNWPLGQGAQWGAANDQDTLDANNGGYINPPSNNGSVKYISYSTNDPIATIETNFTLTLEDGSTLDSPVFNIHCPPGSTAAGYPSALVADNQFNCVDTNSYPGHYFLIWPFDIHNFSQNTTFVLQQGTYSGTHCIYENVTLDYYATQQEMNILPNTDVFTAHYNQIAGVITGYDIDGTQNSARIPGTNLPRIQHKLRYSHDPQYLAANGTGQGDEGMDPTAWPAQYEDWQDPNQPGNLYKGHLKYGTLLGIPKDTPMPAGLTDAGKMIFDALQCYGASIKDVSGGGFHLWVDQNVAAQQWYTDAANDLNNIVNNLKLLRPLRNQHQGRGTGTTGQNFADYPDGGPGVRMDSGPAPLVLPAGFPVPSDNYTIVTPGNGSFIASDGTIWSVTSGNQVAYKRPTDSSAVTDTSTANVTQLAYVDGRIWYCNSSSQWYCETNWWGGWAGPTTTNPISASKAIAYNGPNNGGGGGQTGYQGPWVTVGTSDQTSGVASNLQANTNYVFQVIGVNDAGSGTPSDPASGQTQPGVTSGPQLLPSGELFVGTGNNKAQIVDGNGVPVRIACIGWSGGNSITPGLDGLDSVNWQQTMRDMVRYGFNAVRLLTCDRAVLNDAAMNGVNYTLNPDLQGLTYLGVLDKIFDYAAQIGLRIIVDSHCSDGANIAQAPNGIWYDSGGASNGTDGGGNTGTITDALFLQAWQTRATRWKNKPALLGYDIRNEPLGAGHGNPGCTWGGYTSISGQKGTVGSNIDIRDMYQRVGNAIQAIDSRPLIICEAPIDYPSGAYSGDLRCINSWPVTLNTANKVVYSVHEYPSEVGGYAGSNPPGGLGSADSGDAYVNRIQTQWGFLISNNIAPVWIGECGDYCTTTDAQQWAATFVSFCNGTYSGGPTFSGQQQGISWDWWAWDVDASGGQVPDFGVQTAWGSSGQPRPEQQKYWGQMLYNGPISGTRPLVKAPLAQTAATGTWTLDSINGMYYWTLMPDQFDPNVSYPLVLYLHQNDQGNPFYSNGNSASADIVKPQIDPWFNNTTFRTNHPAIVIAPLLDQTSDTSGETINWGGISSSQQQSQLNNIQLVQYFQQKYNIWPHMVYICGNSMGGDGTWDTIIKYNSQTGTAGKVFTAALALAGVNFNHGYPTPDPTVVSALKTVPIFAIHGGNNDQNSPILWDENMWTAQGGSTPYPGTPQGAKAPNATFWYLEDPNLGHDVWDTYFPMAWPWDWLFSQSN